MLCLVEWVLGVALLANPSLAAPVVLYAFLGDAVFRRSCHAWCAGLFFGCLFVMALAEGEEGVFGGLKVSPEAIELGILQALQYRLGPGLCRDAVTGRAQLLPASDTLWGYLAALVRFIVQPGYGRVYRI